jgi:hypothetical protein
VMLVSGVSSDCGGIGAAVAARADKGSGKQTIMLLCSWYRRSREDSHNDVTGASSRGRLMRIV